MINKYWVGQNLKEGWDVDLMVYEKKKKKFLKPFGPFLRIISDLISHHTNWFQWGCRKSRQTDPKCPGLNLSFSFQTLTEGPLIAKALGPGVQTWPDVLPGGPPDPGKETFAQVTTPKQRHSSDHSRQWDPRTNHSPIPPREHRVPKLLSSLTRDFTSKRTDPKKQFLNY